MWYNDPYWPTYLNPIYVLDVLVIIAFLGLYSWWIYMRFKYLKWNPFRWD